MINLTAESVKRLFPKAIPRSYSKNQIICYNGDMPLHVFFVLKGYVRYYDIDEHGNEKNLHVNGPHNIFPMLYAFGISNEVNGFYASINDVELLAVPLEDFNKAIESNIEFSNTLVRWFLFEIEQLVYRINSLEKTDASVKVIYALKSLAPGPGRQGAWLAVGFPVTHKFIADFTGLARETVSSTMHKLEKSNLIKKGQRGRLMVKAEALEKLS